MAPKKKEQQKMSLGTFLADEKLGSWADEMEDMPLYSRPSFASSNRQYNTTSSFGGPTTSGGYYVREELPLPDKPPFTVHLGNLSFDATSGDVQDFFADCECINVRIIEDKIEMKPKGFGYAEFQTQEGLKQALTLNGTQFQGRNIRISVADPPKDRDRDRPDVRELGEWSRKGPLPDLPSRGGERRGYNAGRSFGDPPAEGGFERRERQFQDDGKLRDLNTWERKGPLSPISGQERSNSSRDGHPRTSDGPQEEGYQRASPAAWGERRGSQEGSRPPRREFQERPERAPTAAEQDNQWRARMRPDPSPKSPVPEPEAASPPAPARPRLNLAKRTVSEATSAASSGPSDAKASPFGAARPIDTATKEKEIEEKRLKEKKDLEDKVREEKRLAKEAAAKAEEEKAAAEADVEAADEPEEAAEPVNGKTAVEPAKPRDAARDAQPPRPSEGGSWRRPPNGPKPGGNDTPRGPRRDGPPRGPRADGPRGPRANGGPAAATSPTTETAPQDPEVAALEADGWSTVSNAKQRKNQRGNGARTMA